MEKETKIIASSLGGRGAEIEQAAALALLDRGAAFHIPAPFLLRLFGKKKIRIVVRRLRLGTLLYLTELPTPTPLKDVPEELAKKIKDTGTEPVSVDLKAIKENLKPVCRIVASCLLNSHWKIPLFARPLGRYLRHHLTGEQIQELIMWLFVYGRAESFTNTIRFIRKMSLTNPMNLSPEVKRSQGAKVPIAFSE
jgi:hypothetical protein